MKKTIRMAFLLALLAPIMSAWAGSTTTYYAALKASVSSSGGGKVYAGTSDSTPAAGSYKSDSSQSDNLSSTTQDESKSFYAFALANEGYEFSHWSTTDNGTSASTANPYAVGVECSSSTESDPTLTTVYAVFKKKTLAVFNIAFATSDAGTYTVDGAAPANKTGLTEATTVVLKSTDPNFLSWNVGGTTVSDNPYTATCLADTTFSANFLTADQVTTATTYEELTAALANAQYVKITIPSDKEITVAKGATLTVPSGRQLVVDGTLVVVGSVSNSGTIPGNGTLQKVSYLVDQGAVKTLYTADGTECGNMALTGHTGKKPRYRVTTVTACSPSVSGSISCTQSWGVMLNGTKPYTIGKQNPKALKVSLNTASAVNEITAITGNADAITETASFVLLADCSLSGPKASNGRYNFQGTVDCAGKTLTVSGAAYDSNFYSIYLNGTIKFNGSSNNYFQNGKAAFFNCSSVTVQYCKNSGNAFYFYDCGSEVSPASVSFSYYSSTRTTDYKTAHFYNGYYNFTFNATDDGSGKCKVYGGSYTSDPSDYLADIDKLEVKYNSSSKYYVVQEKKEVTNVAVIGETPYETLAAAVEAAVSGDTISLVEAVDLTGETVEIPSEKNITIALDKHTVSGGKIVNRGTLVLTDSGTGIGGAVTDASGATVASDIENHGVLNIIFGTYSGAIDNKAGTLTTHNGIFSGTLTKSGGTVNLKGGHFTADITALATVDGCDVTTKGGKYTVCVVPDGTMRDTTVSSAAGYGAKPYSDSDYALLKGWVGGKSSRTDYSAADWQRIAELLCFYQVFNNKGMDPTLVFDREVKTDSLNLNTNPNSGGLAKIKFDVAAGTPYRALTEMLISYGYYAKTYNALFSDNISSVAVAISDKSGNNKGTVCKAMIELWEGVRAPDYSSTKRMITNTVYEVGHKLFTINAGSNLAMIRPATGAATFYATLGAAMDAAADGGTVMLANDCTEGLALDKAGTYTFDTMGFAASDEVSVADGLFVKSSTSVDSSAKVLVADAKATTYVVAQKVAGVGGQFYDNLAEAVAAANGAVVTLYAATDETITLTAEGQSFTLNKNGVSFDDAKVTTSVAGSSVKATAAEGVTTYSLVKDVVSSGDVNYPSIEAAVAATEGNTVSVTVIAADTETVALVAGKTLSVTVADGVTADVTVNPGTDAFIETSADGATTTYISKKITVEMKEPTAAVAVTKIGNGTESEVTDAAEIAAAVAKMTGNHDVPRTDNTDKLDVLDVITVTPVKIVEEVVDGQTVIRSATFDVVPVFHAGQSLAEGQTLKFRLPVDAAATQLSAIAYHNAAQLGVYPVTTENGEKFIEVAASDFSPYGYELLDGETANPVAAIGTTGYATFAAAAAVAVVSGETVVMLAAPDASDICVLAVGKSLAVAKNGFEPAVTAADGANIKTDETDGTTSYTAVAEPKENMVARIGNVPYLTLDAAVVAAAAGDTVELLADLTNSVSIAKDITLDGNGHTLTCADGGPAVNATGGATVTLADITVDAAGRAMYPVQAVSGATLALGGGVRLSNGLWCNLHVNGATVTGGQGVTMAGTAAIVGADGKIRYNGEDRTEEIGALLQAVYAGAAKNYAAGEEIVLPFFDIVREGEESIAISESADGAITQGGSLLFVADGAFGSAETGNVTLPARFQCYTLDLGATSATGWTEGEWNDIINTGCTVLEAMAAGASSAIGVTLKLNDAVTAIPGDGFAFTNGNFTVDGQGHTLTGKIYCDETSGALENLVAGTDDAPLTVDITALDGVFTLAGDVAPTNLVFVLSGEQIASGLPVIALGGDGEIPADGTVKIVSAGGGDEPFFWDEDLHVAYVGAQEARLADARGGTPRYLSLSAAFEAAAAGDTVTLLKDVTMGEHAYAGHAVSIDGDGHSITFVKDDLEPHSYNDFPIWIEAAEGGALSIRDATFSGTAGNYTLGIENASSTLSNVTVNANGNIGLCIQGGSAKLADVAVRNTGVNASGADSFKNAALTLAGGADVVVEGGEYTSANGYAVYLLTTGGRLTIRDGVFAGKVCAGANNASVASEILIQGGRFDVPEFRTYGGGTAKIAISGGLFAQEPDASFLAEGHIAVANREKATMDEYPYTVRQAWTVRWKVGDVVVKTSYVTNGTPAAAVEALAPASVSAAEGGVEGNKRLTGWAPAFTAAVADATYTAQFEAVESLAGPRPGTLRFTAISARGGVAKVSFAFAPDGGEGGQGLVDAYRLVFTDSLVDGTKFLSDAADVTLDRADGQVWSGTAVVALPAECASSAFFTGLEVVVSE